MMLVPALTLDASQLVRVRAIYEDGFAAHLRTPFEDLLADRAHVLLDSEPRGLAVLRALGDTGWVFLRYFVVGTRGQGHGEVLWTRLRAAMSGAGFSRIVYDVEDPAEHGIPAEEETIRRRRIAFYTRLGAVLLPANGYLPPHGDDTHPMLLMASETSRGTDPILGEDLRGVMLAVYRHRYGLDPGSPVVTRTLRLSGL
jgi:hypothetical protein